MASQAVRAAATANGEYSGEASTSASGGGGGSGGASAGQVRRLRVRASTQRFPWSSAPLASGTLHTRASRPAFVSPSADHSGPLSREPSRCVAIDACV